MPSSKDVIAVPLNGSNVETSSEVHEEGDLKDGGHSKDLDVTPKDSSHSNELEVTPKNATSLLQSGSLAQSQPMASTPSSPSFGTASTSTLPKEDELSSTVNGSSESNWDKNSQSSQNGSKPSERAEESKTQHSASAWNDEGSPSALLKEAPPPAVNIWQYRKEIHEAKAKTKQASGPQAPKLTTQFVLGGHANNLVKNSDSSVDSRKQESKKKAKSSPAQVEERPALGSNKEGNKAGEARMRGPDESGLLIVFLYDG